MNWLKNLPTCAQSLRSVRLPASAILFSILAAPAAAVQTWTGAAADGGNWNGITNWSPSGLPDATTDLIFDASGAAVPTVNIIGSNGIAKSLSFNSGTINYNITSAGPTLGSVTAITRSNAAGGAAPTISLTNITTGSLLFPNGNLTITNNAPSTAVTSPTLVIGPNTVIGQVGAGGSVIVAGTGTTTISGSFSTTGNLVTGGLTKTGTGTLNLSGSASGLAGTVTVAGGTLRLDYGASTADKLGTGTASAAGSLALSGGSLTLVAHAATPVSQSVSGAGGTVLNVGHTNVLLSTNSGALAGLTLNLGAITRPAIGGTLDVNVSQTGAVATTTTALSSNILGGWATANSGASWATKSGSNIVPLASFGTDSYLAGINTDVTTNASLSAGTFTNSLRFNNAFSTLTITSGSVVIQSGGILATTAGNGGTITGGTLTTLSPLELNVHAYKGITINSALSLTGGLTKAGPQVLTLGGNLGSFSGPINVNQGGLNFTSTNALSSTISTINLNDRSGTSQSLTFTLTDGQDFPMNIPIRLGANNTLSLQTDNARIFLNGVISSPAGLTTPLGIISSSNTSGFNFNNAANTFTGDVTLGGNATLGIAANGSLGDAANRLLLNSGASAGGLEFLSNATDLTHPVVLSSSSRVLVGSGNTNTISGQISGFGVLVKDGTGTLVLSNAGNTNTGGVQINAGALRVAAAGNLGTSGGIVLNNGTLALTGTFSIPASRTLSLAPTTLGATPTIDVATGQTVTIAGPVTNSGGNATLVKTGAGTLILNSVTSSYSGGTTVQQGALQVASDFGLGLAGTPVTVNTLGTLTYTATTFTARTFDLDGSTLTVAPTRTLTFNNATVLGGFLTGAFATQSGSQNTFIAGNTTTSTTLVQNASTDSFTNFSHGGQLTTPSGATATLTRFTNTSSGGMTLAGTANAADLVSNGLLTINAGGTLNTTQGGLVLGGGSRTFIGSVGSPGGTLNLNGQTLNLNGGLLVNNGTIVGTVNVNYGSLAKGAGTYGTVNMNDGGIFAPGNSPGIANATSVTFSSNSTIGGPTLAIEIAGTAPGSQYDQLQAANSVSLGGTLNASLLSGFVPDYATQFSIIAAPSITGRFSGFIGYEIDPNRYFALLYSPTQTELAVAIPGDANLNGAVTFADFVTLANNFGQPNAGWLGADFNNDNTTNFSDFVILANHFGQTISGNSFTATPDELAAMNAFATASSVPEPATLPLLALSILLLRRKSRHSV